VVLACTAWRRTRARLPQVLELHQRRLRLRVRPRNNQPQAASLVAQVRRIEEDGVQCLATVHRAIAAAAARARPGSG
jgi:hypothetical protein